jgi:hypothetical protein
VQRTSEELLCRYVRQCGFAELGGGTSVPGTLSFTTADGRWWGLHID